MNLVVRDILHLLLLNPLNDMKSVGFVGSLKKTETLKICMTTMFIATLQDVLVMSRICKGCHDPDYIHKPYDNNHKCPARGKKGKYRCNECDLHMWICDKHQEANKETLEKFRDTYKADFNLNFGSVLIIFCLILCAELFLSRLIK